MYRDAYFYFTLSKPRRFYFSIKGPGESWQEFNGLKYLENPGEGVIKKTECTLKYLI
jgi:hypothetical protein